MKRQCANLMVPRASAEQILFLVKSGFHNNKYYAIKQIKGTQRSAHVKLTEDWAADNQLTLAAVEQGLNEELRKF